MELNLRVGKLLGSHSLRASSPGRSVGKLESCNMWSVFFLHMGQKEQAGFAAVPSAGHCENWTFPVFLVSFRSLYVTQ